MYVCIIAHNNTAKFERSFFFFLLIIGMFSLFSIIFMPYLESNITSDIFYSGFTAETLRSVRTTNQNLKNLGTHFLCT